MVYMAIYSSAAISNAIKDAIKGSFNLFSSINKVEGQVSETENTNPIDEYESTLPDRKIIDLKNEWLRRYNKYYSDVEGSQNVAFEYWIGKQKVDDEVQVGTNKNLVDNVVFESIETLLPIATRANPDPLVQSDPSELGQRAAKHVKAAIVDEADRLKLRRKLSRMLRHWLIYRIGVMKIMWDVETRNIDIQLINPKRMIFDPDGHIDESGNFIGEYLGEKKTETADTLLKLFPKSADVINAKAQEKKGTKIDYTEWWYCNTDVFFTLGDHVLGKFKNPHWNYDGKVKVKDPITEQTTEQEVQGKNHFNKMLSPYVFLSIFSTGLQPHDETSLVLQVVGIQDMINRRWAQIDQNVKSMNNGLVVSGVSFTEEQASQAATALRRGTAIRVPNGDVRSAVIRLPADPIPSQVLDMMMDGRNEMKNILGISGSTPQGVAQQKDVRGKILVSQMDTSRIGGGITEQLEQVADSIYNWFVQMMFVYWDEEHYVNSIGPRGGTELLVIKNDMFQSLKTLDITVKEGTLIPKDPLTQRNEAMDLWSANAIDPINLFNRLDYGDPNESAKQLILWQMVQKGQIPPTAYIPDFEIPMQGQLPQEQAGTGGPAVNPLGTPQPQPPVQSPSPTSEQIQEKQLIQSVPIR